MTTNQKRLTSRVFRAGNSQAVRIPKAFELPEGEVVIEQRAGGLFVKVKRSSWAKFFAKPPLSVDLDPTELRATDPVRPVDFDFSARSRPGRHRAK